MKAGLLTSPFSSSLGDTGIGSYGANLFLGLDALEDVSARTVPEGKAGLDLRVREVGGFVGALKRTFLSSAPTEHDVVHATDPAAMRDGVDVVTVHDLVPLKSGWDEGGFTNRLLWRALRRKLTDAHIIVPSLQTKGDVLHLLDACPERVHHVTWGIDRSLYKPRDLTDTQKARWSLTSGDNHVLWVGDLDHSMQFRPFVEALDSASQLLQERTHVHWAGPGRWSQKFWSTFRGFDNDLVPHQHGYVSNDELAQLYSGVDLLVFPSTREGFGLPPVEAAACGTPTVTTPLPVLGEVLGDMRYELPSMRRTPEWSQALTGFLSAPQLSANDLSRKTRKHTLDRMARETVEVYEEAI